MPEEVVDAPAQENNGVVNIQTSPFGNNSWSDAPPEPAEKVETPAVSTQQPTQTPSVQNTPAQEEEDEILDPRDYLKREFDIDDVAVLKAEREELKKLRESKPEVAYQGIPEEKEDEFFNYLATKKQLEKVEKINVDNAKDASDLLKTYYKFKYPDFNENEIREHFEDQYSKQAIPKQQDTQTDEEYAEIVESIKLKNDAIDRRIIRDAKVVKPEFSEFKTKIVRPELPKYEPKQEAPSQESLAKLREQRENFLNKLESEYNKFEGFTTKVKDESVEIPVTFKAPDEVKSAIKERFKAGFDLNEFLDKRWSDEKGAQKIEQLISDIYVLENLDKILSGVANNAANQRLAEYIKSKKNPSINGIKTPQQTFEQNNNGKAVSPFAKDAWSETPPSRNN